MTKHEQIEKIIIDMIEQGLVQPGEPVPSTREMAKVYGMSVTPVIEAYHNLEKNGIIIAKTKSKFVSSGRIENKPLLEELELDTTMIPNSNLTVYHDVYSSWQIDEIKFPFGTPRLFVAQDNNSAILAKFSACARDFYTTQNYGNIMGDLPQLKQELSKLMFKFNCPTSPDDIILFNCSLYAALTVALEAITKSGDYVGIANPGSIVHNLVLRSRGLNAVPLNVIPGKGLSLESLKQAHYAYPQMKCIIVAVNIDKPTGTAMSDDDKANLADFCIQNGITIIEDDSYGSFNFESFRPRPLLSFAPDHIIYISHVNFVDSISMGLSWMITKIEKENILYYRNMMEFLPTEMLQYCYSCILGERMSEKRREVANQIHKHSTDLVCAEVYKQFPVGIQVYKPQGGAGLWIKLPVRCDTQQLLNQVLPLGVSFFPGALFSIGEDYNNYLYLNCSVIDGHPERLEGIRILGKEIKKYLNS